MKKIITKNIIVILVIIPSIFIYAYSETSSPPVSFSASVTAYLAGYCGH